MLGASHTTEQRITLTLKVQTPTLKRSKPIAIQSGGKLKNKSYEIDDKNHYWIGRYCGYRTSNLLRSNKIKKSRCN